MGNAAKERALASMQVVAPTNSWDAEVLLMGASFNALQGAVAVGPGEWGYDLAGEPEVRIFVQEYADLFASVYADLGAIEHPLATDPNHFRYFASNVQYPMNDDGGDCI